MGQFRYVLLFSIFALLNGSAFKASALDTDQILSTLGGGEMCFARSYSSEHLAKHPKQTVTEIRASLVDMADADTVPTPALDLVFKVKGERNYLRQGLTCTDLDGRVSCYVDCDGGSVEIGELNGRILTLRNNGLTIEGGCDSNEVIKYLENKKGGDDVFILDRVHPSLCKAAVR